MLTAKQTDIRALHERLGKVNSQPIDVTSFTNKRFTVNYHVPLWELRRIVPKAIEVEEIHDTGFGMLSMCACDFWVTQLAQLPLPPIRNNDMQGSDGLHQQTKADQHHLLGYPGSYRFCLPTRWQLRLQLWARYALVPEDRLSSLGHLLLSRIHLRLLLNAAPVLAL